MVNTMYKTTKEMIDKLQQLKCKLTLNFSEDVNSYYDEMNSGRQNPYFHFEEDRFSRSAQNMTTIMQEVFSSVKIIQRKTQARSNSVNCFDLYCTVILSLTVEKNEV